MPRFFSAVYQHGVKWTGGEIFWDTDDVSLDRERKNHWKLLLPCHLSDSLSGQNGTALYEGLQSSLLLHKDCCRFSPTHEVKCSFKCAFEHWKTNKWFQKQMWEPLWRYVNCLFVTWRDKKKISDVSFSCTCSLCLDLVGCRFLYVSETGTCKIFNLI